MGLDPQIRPARFHHCIFRIQQLHLKLCLAQQVAVGQTTLRYQQKFIKRNGSFTWKSSPTLTSHRNVCPKLSVIKMSTYWTASKRKTGKTRPPEIRPVFGVRSGISSTKEYRLQITKLAFKSHHLNLWETQFKSQDPQMFPHQSFHSYICP